MLESCRYDTCLAPKALCRSIEKLSDLGRENSVKNFAAGMMPISPRNHRNFCGDFADF